MQVLIFFSMGSGEAGINLSQIQAALTTGISYEGALTNIKDSQVIKVLYYLAISCVYSHILISLEMDVIF